MPDIDQRLRYFSRQFLEVRDFRDEQDYLLDRLRRHLRQHHCPGIAEGLEVDAAAGAAAVAVTPGTALDAEGRQIVLAEPASVALDGLDGRVLVLVSYHEVASDPADGPGTERRWHELPRLEAVAEADAPAAVSHVRLARLEVASGILLVHDPSVRVASDRCSPPSEPPPSEPEPPPSEPEPEPPPPEPEPEPPPDSPTTAELYQDVVLADNPQGYWKLDETSGTTAVDASGNGNHGTYQGGVTLGREGVVGASPTAELDGTGWVDLIGEWGGTPAATVEAWIRPAGRTRTFQAIVSAETLEFVHLQLYAGGNNVAYTTEGVVNLAILPVGPLDTWRHIVMVIESGNSRIYVDGQVFDQSSMTFSDILPTKKIRIGSGYEQGRFFLGRLSQVAVYPHALSEDRILARFHLVTGSSAGQLSDLAWKENVATVPDALAKVSALRGVTFDWRRDKRRASNLPAGRRVGLIAQEVEKVVPEVVARNGGGAKTLEYGPLVAVLIEAVKELDAERRALGQRVAALEAGTAAKIEETRRELSQ